MKVYFYEIVKPLSYYTLATKKKKHTKRRIRLGCACVPSEDVANLLEAELAFEKAQQKYIELMDKYLCETTYGV